MELEPHILALLGALTAGGGVLLLVWGISAAASREDATRESLLAPTLAVDTLDDELRVAYMRTLVLDARLQAHSTGHQDTTALGRELRRALLEIQANRHAGELAPVTPVESILTEANERVEASSRVDELEDLIETARAIRRSIKEIRASHRSFE